MLLWCNEALSMGASNSRCSGVRTRRQSENWCWPENDAMYDCGIMATTLRRRPPDTVAVPIGKQNCCGANRQTELLRCQKANSTGASTESSAVGYLLLLRAKTLFFSEGIKRQETQHRSLHMCCGLSDTDSVQCITPKHALWKQAQGFVKQAI
jgi:hypothetical protein